MSWLHILTTDCAAWPPLGLPATRLIHLSGFTPTAYSAVGAPLIAPSSLSGLLQHRQRDSPGPSDDRGGLRLLDVTEVFEIFLRRQLHAKSSKCEFGLHELGFLGHRARLSAAGVLVNSRKLQSSVGRGAVLLGGSKLLLPLRGALRRGRSAADGSRKHGLQGPRWHERASTR